MIQTCSSTDYKPTANVGWECGVFFFFCRKLQMYLSEKAEKHNDLPMALYLAGALTNYWTFLLQL